MSNLVSLIYAVIESDDWINSIEEPIYPSDYKGSISAIPYLRISVVPGDTKRYDYSGNKHIHGLVIIDIFTKSGSGQRVPFEIANKLNSVLESRSLDDKTCLDYSNIQPIGEDSDDKTMFMHQYTIPITYFGE